MKLARFVKFRADKFGGVLFETRSEKVFTLNPTATAVIREIESGASESELADRIKAQFDGDDGAIEREVGSPLEWVCGEDRKLGQIKLRKGDTDPTDRSAWPAQHDWLLGALETFHRVFAPRVKRLSVES